MATKTQPTVLIGEDELSARINALALEIRQDLPAGQIHLIAVLKGAFLFLGDLIRAMDGYVTIDFMACSSYGAGTSSSGEVRLSKDLDVGIEGRDVIIVEDIVDTGLTLRSEEHTSELQSRLQLVCRPLLENNKSRGQ